jgi:DNA repair exonuclease SbcCD ATPase subunit
MEIPKNLKDEIWEYCRLNDITDLNAFMLKSLQQGFNIEKYGPTPFTVGGKEPEVIEKEVEKIVEVIKEVPVEVIKEIIKEVPVVKEVEKIVEVPVEIIKEVMVEKPFEVVKEVFITDDESVNKLQEELESVKANEKVHLKGLRDKVTELKEKDVEILDLNRKISDLDNNILQLEKDLNELGGKTTKLEEELEEERKKVLELSESDDESIRSLTQQIENLKIELELEKNRHYQKPKKEKPKDDKPKSLGTNIINWVSKSERNGDKDLYGE